MVGWLKRLFYFGFSQPASKYVPLLIGTVKKISIQEFNVKVYFFSTN